MVGLAHSTVNNASLLSNSTKVKYYMIRGMWNDKTSGTPLQELPLEVVHIIIDFAGYWNVSTIGKQQDIHGQNLDKVYFIMNTRVFLQHPYYDESLVPLKQLIIEVRSHDQGWSSYPSDQNTYRGSWTFGEIAVLDAYMDEQQIQRFDLYRNLHANSKWQIHRKVFNFVNAEYYAKKYANLSNEQINENIAAQEQVLLKEHPQQEVKYWIASPEECIRMKKYIMDGYNLGFMVRSAFPGWCNYVSEIKIAAYF